MNTSVLAAIQENQRLLTPVLTLELDSITYRQALALCDGAAGDVTNLICRVQGASLPQNRRQDLVNYLIEGRSVIRSKRKVYESMVGMLASWNLYGQASYCDIDSRTDVAINSATSVMQSYFNYEEHYADWLRVEDDFFRGASLPTIHRVALLNSSSVGETRKQDVWQLAEDVLQTVTE